MYSNWSNSPSTLAIHISSLDIMRVVAEKTGPNWFSHFNVYWRQTDQQSIYIIQ